MSSDGRDRSASANRVVQPRFRWVAWLRPAFGLGLLGALILYVDFEVVLSQLTHLATGWMFLAMACILVSTLLGAFNVFLLMARSGNVSLGKFLPIYWVGWSLSLIVPGQVGDLAGISTLLRRHRYDWHQSLGPGFLDKFISLVLMSALAAIGLTQTLGLDKRVRVLGLVAAVSLVAGGGLVIFAPRLWRRLFNPRGKGLRGLVGRTLGEMRRIATTHYVPLAANTALTVAKIVLTGGSYWAIFSGLGFGEVRLLDVVPLVAVSSLVAYIPVSFNGMGTAEAAGIFLFGRLGVTASGVVTTYLLLRITILVMAWVPSGLWLLIRGRGASCTGASAAVNCEAPSGSESKDLG